MAKLKLSWADAFDHFRRICPDQIRTRRSDQKKIFGRISQGSRDRTKQPLTPGDRTRKIFLVGSWHTNLGSGDRTEMKKCFSSRFFKLVFRRISGVETQTLVSQICMARVWCSIIHVSCCGQLKQVYSELRGSLGHEVHWMPWLSGPLSWIPWLSGPSDEGNGGSLGHGWKIKWYHFSYFV